MSSLRDAIKRLLSNPVTPSAITSHGEDTERTPDHAPPHVRTPEDAHAGTETLRREPRVQAAAGTPDSLSSSRAAAAPSHETDPHPDERSWAPGDPSGDDTERVDAGNDAYTAFQAFEDAERQESLLEEAYWASTYLDTSTITATEDARDTQQPASSMAANRENAPSLEHCSAPTTRPQTQPGVVECDVVSVDPDGTREERADGTSSAAARPPRPVGLHDASIGERSVPPVPTAIPSTEADTAPTDLDGALGDDPAPLPSMHEEGDPAANNSVTEETSPSKISAAPSPKRPAPASQAHMNPVPLEPTASQEAWEEYEGPTEDDISDDEALDAYDGGDDEASWLDAEEESWNDDVETDEDDDSEDAIVTHWLNKPRIGNATTTKAMGAAHGHNASPAVRTDGALSLQDILAKNVDSMIRNGTISTEDRETVLRIVSYYNAPTDVKLIRTLLQDGADPAALELALRLLPHWIDYTSNIRGIAETAMSITLWIESYASEPTLDELAGSLVEMLEAYRHGPTRRRFNQPFDQFLRDAMLNASTAHSLGDEVVLRIQRWGARA